MKHRLTLTIALAALVCSAVAATASAGRGGHGQLVQFRGEVVSATATSVQITVEGGNHAALRAMLGQSQNQTFTLGPKSEVLVWNKGIPTVGSYTDLKTNDWVQVNIRARDAKSLADVESNPAGIVGDHGAAPGKAGKPLFLFRGTYAGSPTAGKINVDVKGGNRLALRKLLGQSTSTQTFTYDSNTIFLLWQGKVPTVIGAADLKAGDRITVRIRAPRLSSLSDVENTPARHVGEHEPASAADKS
ncbi:MAG: hypothetical protein ACTHKS_17740 [Gaiellaceae bacterium]